MPTTSPKATPAYRFREQIQPQSQNQRVLELLAIIAQTCLRADQRIERIESLLETLIGETEARQ
jgi:hypothetical protein